MCEREQSLSIGKKLASPQAAVKMESLDHLVAEGVDDDAGEVVDTAADDEAGYEAALKESAVAEQIQDKQRYDGGEDADELRGPAIQPLLHAHGAASSVVAGAAAAARR
jgi:hypothetical protein